MGLNVCKRSPHGGTFKGERPGQLVMGLRLIAALYPLCIDLSHLILRLEYIGIEHFVSIGPIEPFDEGILVQLARLNILACDPAVDAPARKAVGEEFRAMVEAKRLRLAAPGDDLFEHTDYPFVRWLVAIVPKSSPWRLSQFGGSLRVIMCRCIRR